MGSNVGGVGQSEIIGATLNEEDKSNKRETMNEVDLKYMHMRKSASSSEMPLSPASAGRTGTIDVPGGVMGLGQQRQNAGDRGTANIEGSVCLLASPKVGAGRRGTDGDVPLSSQGQAYGMHMRPSGQ